MARTDRKSTRLNSSHSSISYAVFCLKKKKSCSVESVSQSEHSSSGSIDLASLGHNRDQMISYRSLVEHDLFGNLSVGFFFFNDTATTEIYTLSLHDALPIFQAIAAKVKEGGKDAPCCDWVGP